MLHGQKISNFIFYHVGHMLNVTGISNFLELP